MLITAEPVKLLIEPEKCQHTQHLSWSKKCVSGTAFARERTDSVSTKTSCGSLAPDQYLACHTMLYPNLLTISCSGEAVSQNELFVLCYSRDTVLVALKFLFLLLAQALSISVYHQLEMIDMSEYR